MEYMSQIYEKTNWPDLLRYNCTLSVHQLVENSDFSFALDNEATPPGSAHKLHYRYGRTHNHGQAHKLPDSNFESGALPL